jgi:hypothetical protein
MAEVAVYGQLPYHRVHDAQHLRSFTGIEARGSTVGEATNLSRVLWRCMGLQVGARSVANLESRNDDNLRRLFRHQRDLQLINKVLPLLHCT